MAEAVRPVFAVGAAQQQIRLRVSQTHLRQILFRHLTGKCIGMVDIESHFSGNAQVKLVGQEVIGFVRRPGVVGSEFPEIVAGVIDSEHESGFAVVKEGPVTDDGTLEVVRYRNCFSGRRRQLFHFEIADFKIGVPGAAESDSAGKRDI